MLYNKFSTYFLLKIIKTNKIRSVIISDRGSANQSPFIPIILGKIIKQGIMIM